MHAFHKMFSQEIVVEIISKLYIYYVIDINI